MKWLAWLAVILIPASAQGELYLIAGTPTQDSNERFASALVQVQDGTVKLSKVLTPPGQGIEWIAISYDLRKAVILPLDNGASDKPVVVLDLDQAAVVKECVRPEVKGSLTDEWLADVPGQGSMFDWHVVRSLQDSEVRGMLLDASLPCEKSFPPVIPGAFRYITTHGTAGSGFSEGIHVAITDKGELQGFPPLTSFDVAEIPPEFRKDAAFTWVVLNNSQALVLDNESRDHMIHQTVAFRKRDRTWHGIPASSGVMLERAFGNFIALTDAPYNKATVAQNKAHPGLSSLIRNSADEQSAGRAEWRAESTDYGPSIRETLENDDPRVFSGRLHLYNIETERLFTLETKQGDSEILLVENNTVYYRSSDRLYSAPITDKGIGTAKLIATDDIIRDSHWAFIKH